MDSHLACVNGKSGRQSWHYHADAFQRSTISEAIYHFYLHTYLSLQKTRCLTLLSSLPISLPFFLPLLLCPNKAETFSLLAGWLRDLVTLWSLDFRVLSRRLQRSIRSPMSMSNERWFFRSSVGAELARPTCKRRVTRRRDRRHSIEIRFPLTYSQSERNWISVFRTSVVTM